MTGCSYLTLFNMQYQVMDSRSTGKDQMNIGEALGSVAFLWISQGNSLPVEPDPRYVHFKFQMSKNNIFYDDELVEEIESEYLNEDSHPQYFYPGSYLSTMNEHS